MALFVGRLPRDIRPRELEDVFGKFGRICRCEVKTGYAFVEYDDRRDAEDALKECNGKDYFSSNPITIEWAKAPRSRRGPGGDISSSECFRCGRLGHYARDCPERGRDGGRRRGGGYRDDYSISRSRSRSRDRRYARRRSRSYSRSRSRSHSRSRSPRRRRRHHRSYSRDEYPSGSSHRRDREDRHKRPSHRHHHSRSPDRNDRPMEDTPSVSPSSGQSSSFQNDYKALGAAGSPSLHQKHYSDLPPAYQRSSSSSSRDKNYHSTSYDAGLDRGRSKHRIDSPVADTGSIHYDHDQQSHYHEQSIRSTDIPDELSLPLNGESI